MNDSDPADERWYRIAMGMLGALIGSLVVFIIGGPLIYYDVASFSLLHAAGGGAIVGAIIAVIVPATVIHALEVAMWFLAGLFGAPGSTRLELDELPGKSLWLVIAFLVGALYFFIPALL